MHLPGVLENSAGNKESNNYLQLKLNGDDPNRQGIGAKITLYVNGDIQFHEHYLQRGYKSTMSEIVHFGLGGQKKVDSLTIVWPDGKTETQKNINSNQRLNLYKKDAFFTEKSNDAIKTPQLMEEITDQFGLQHQHQTSDYADFLDQYLIPHKFSGNGPGMAVGDINGDGLEDFFIGGGAGFPGCFSFSKTEDLSSSPCPSNRNRKIWAHCCLTATTIVFLTCMW
jgi:enediyne biosynthesis protein E4